MQAAEIFVLSLNLLAFLLMFYDKLVAKGRRFRVPEKVLIMLAIMGGSAGIWLGMKIWRHKTKHRLFSLGIPLIIFLQVALLLYWQL
ncbi:MAG: DUF1294 domain-containing protein [Firmicutes bacterium]|nr:DUF1294 domain-containing protein [Bacillota bacterium]